ncbi:unnamed protein product, partial [Oikopleura dioica]
MSHAQSSGRRKDDRRGEEERNDSVEQEESSRVRISEPSRVDGTTDDAHGNEQFSCFCSSKTDIRAGQDSGQQGNVTAGENVSPALEQYSAVQWCKPDQQSDGANDWKSESNASSECEHVSDFWNSHDKAKWT